MGNNVKVLGVTANSPPGSRAQGHWAVPLLCLVVTGALIGLSVNLAKLAVAAGLGALPFLAWSVTGAAIVLSCILAVFGRLPPLNRQTVTYFFIAALISISVPQLILFASVPHVGAGFAVLSVAFPPLYTYAGALIMRMERFDTVRAGGMALAFGGVVVLAALKAAAPDAALGWVAATLFAPVLLAAGNIYRTLCWPAGARPDGLAPGMMAAAGVLLLAAGALPGFSLHVPFETAIPILLILGQMAAFSVQYLLFFVLQKYGGPVYLSLLGPVAAIVGVPIAVLLLGETPPPGLAVSAALIVSGIGIVTLRNMWAGRT